MSSAPIAMDIFEALVSGNKGTSIHNSKRKKIDKDAVLDGGRKFPLSHCRKYKFEGNMVDRKLKYGRQ